MDLPSLKSLLVRHEALIAELTVVDRQLRALVDAELVASQTPRPLPPPVAPVAPSPATAAASLEPPTSFRTKMDYLLWKIRQGEGTIEINECARELYGSDSLKNRNRVSRLLNYMSGKAMLRMVAPLTYDILGKVG